MRLQLYAALLCLVMAVGGWAQGLRDAQQAAKAMGYTGTLRADSEVGGITMYSGKGLMLMYGGAIAGSRLIKAPVDSELNRGAKPVTSAEGAIARVKEFIQKYGAPVGITAAPESVVASAEPDSGHGYSGWSVELYVEDNGHRGLPAYKASVDRSGAVVNLMYVPLVNKVASEPTITRDQARDALLRKAGQTGDYTYKSSELEVMPDQRGGCALGWLLSLAPTKAGEYGVNGAVDATTGKVLWSGPVGSVPPPVPKRVDSQGAWLAFGLVALGGLLVVFLVVKLRKR